MFVVNVKVVERKPGRRVPENKMEMNVAGWSPFLPIQQENIGPLIFYHACNYPVSTSNY